MPTIKFTVRSLDAVKPPATGRVDYWDADLPGFGLRIAAPSPKRPELAPRKVWTVMYRADGSQFRLSLGPYSALPLAEARQMAKDAMREVAHGRNPAAQKKAARLAETVSDLADLYIDKHARPALRVTSTVWIAGAASWRTAAPRGPPTYCCSRT